MRQAKTWLAARGFTDVNDPGFDQVVDGIYEQWHEDEPAPQVAPASQAEHCDYCNGTGLVVPFMLPEADCPRCSGRGRV